MSKESKHGVAMKKPLTGKKRNLSPLLLSPLFFFSFFLCLLILNFTISAFGQESISSSTPEATPHGLEPRIPAQKPKTIKVPKKGVYKNIIIVKLVEGSMVRLRGNAFVSLNQDLPPNLNSSLSSLNDLLFRPEVKQVRRHFTQPELELDAEKERVEQLSRKQLADLNLYFQLHLKSGTDPEPILSALNALDIVEIAYLPPIPEPAIIRPAEEQQKPTNPSLPAGKKGDR